ncbi:Hypothetical predicted protein [Podarcis lilfordi]|uniref:Uncharacterized protein n=1 Tax=Podarcis lilfordi TaxID=74358 RepID=A0AA35KLI8_9SAUR|nr:Hypothetical predicted protein [Podarcis lilfordi]
MKISFWDLLLKEQGNQQSGRKTDIKGSGKGQHQLRGSQPLPLPPITARKERIVRTSVLLALAARILSLPPPVEPRADERTEEPLKQLTATSSQVCSICVGGRVFILM